MSTLQERMALAKQHFEKTKGKKFKNVELAEYCKVSKVSIGQWINGPTKELEGSNLTRAADFLGVNHKWLAGERSPMIIGDGSSTLDLEPPISSLIPILSWQQANQDHPLQQLNADHADWLAAHPNLVKDCYALEVLGESMLPEFRPHDQLYVTTAIQIKQLKTGDFVIVQTQEKDALFKRLVIETDGMFLQVINEKWPQQTMPLTASFKIVAKVVGFWRDLNN